MGRWGDGGIETWQVWGVGELGSVGIWGDREMGRKILCHATIM
ncbi:MULTISPECIES: hypothetical protein [unclassified Okeania]|nr:MULTISPECIES: hypothetical protein [unclassified Okeania]